MKWLLPLLALLLAQPASSQTCANTTAFAASSHDSAGLLGAAAADARVLQALQPLLVDPQQTTPAPDIRLRRADLPRVRPVQPWPYRNMSSVLDVVEPTYSASGVMTFSVVHAPLAKVTVRQLQWWVNQDLEKVAEYAGDGKKHSLFLQWHPRDHCHQIIQATGPPANSSQGDTILFQQYLNASRPFTKNNFVGFDSVAEAQHSINFTVTTLNAQGIEYSIRVSGITVVSIRNGWKATNAGAQLTTTWRFGNELLGAAVNKLIICAFTGGAEPSATAQHTILHTVEEIGNLERILPGLFARRNKL